MRNTNKKGFTIVELVVVVAVIAILAAVLIPTFSGVIAKANLSADQKAVHDMNTAIAMEGAETLEEAMAALDKHNINNDKLIPVSKGYSFAWNENDKKIELKKAEEITEDIADSVKKIAVAVNTADTLVDAIDEGLKYIKVEANMAYPERSLTVESGNNVTIDLNGHTITLPEFNDGKVDRHNYVEVEANAKLTLVGGTIEARGVQAYEGGELIIKGTKIVALDTDGGAAVYSWSNSKVTIESGEFIATKNAECIINAGGEVVINGGTFTHTAEGAIRYAIDTNAGTTTVNNATITSTRGVFYCVGTGNIVVADGTFTAGGENNGWCSYTEDDGKVVINGGSFTGSNMFHGNTEDNRNK